MAYKLGFYVIETKRQYILPSAPRDELVPVVDELSYDLEPHDQAVPAMAKHFDNQIPAAAQRTSERWFASASALKGYFGMLREDNLTYRSRAQLLDRLAMDAERAHGERVRWRRAGDDWV